MRRAGLSPTVSTPLRQVIKSQEEEERLRALEPVKKKTNSKPHVEGFPDWANRLNFSERQETRFARSSQLVNFSWPGRSAEADAMVLMLGLAMAQRKTPQGRVTITYTNSVPAKDPGRCAAHVHRATCWQPLA